MFFGIFFQIFELNNTIVKIIFWSELGAIINLGMTSASIGGLGVDTIRSYDPSPILFLHRHGRDSGRLIRYSPPPCDRILIYEPVRGVINTIPPGDL